MDTGFARLQKYDTRFRLVPFATCTSCFSETPCCIPDLSVHTWHQHSVAKGAVSDLIALHLNLSLFSYCQIRQEWSETETEKSFLLFNNYWWLFAMNLACVVFSFLLCYSITMACLHTVSDAGWEGKKLETEYSVVYDNQGNEWTRTRNKTNTKTNNGWRDA